MNLFLPQIVEVRGISMGVNYGADRLRFPAPVPVGSRVRGSGELIAAEDTKDGAVQATVRVTVEIEGGDRPACVDRHDQPLLPRVSARVPASEDPLQQFRLDGKVALVTGGSRGLGTQIVLAYARCGRGRGDREPQAGQLHRARRPGRASETGRRALARPPATSPTGRTATRWRSARSPSSAGWTCW